MEQQLREKEGQNKNLTSELRETQQQLREKEDQKENVTSQLRETQQQLREKEDQNENLTSQLRETQQQLREKEDQKENLTRQLRETQQQLREKEDQKENLTSQLGEMEQQLREKEDQKENLTSQLGEMEQQLREKEDQKENLTSQLSETVQQLTNLQGQLERQLMVKEQRVNELEVTLSAAQHALSEYERQQVTPDWVISRDQIHLTDKPLGAGGWGSVFEGKYCGSSVAVKQIHGLIVSPYNRSLFEREINIAAKCRHPCLLQFIGATNDEGSPLFVTELMESDLRTLLKQRPLSSTEVSIISLDVARAVSYLHEKKPSPIIHRDISSANVLLWRQGDKWRGKVSDYGTVKIMQHTMTVAPGAVIYSAPEALTPHQTVKVSYDVSIYLNLSLEVKFLCCRNKLSDS